MVTSIQIAAHRLFWYDEFGTILISRLPNQSTIVTALAHVDSNMPVLYYMVVHWFEVFLGQSEVAARLPSALGLVVGLWVTYDCARRLTDAYHGLFAISLLACTFLPHYGAEARSYGIYFMLAACCLWVWLQVKGKWSSALLFGTLLFLAVQFHFYAALCLVPFAASEAWGWKKWSMPSAKLVAGGLAVCCAALTLRHQISNASRYSTVFWSRPDLYKLHRLFAEVFPQGLFLLAVIMIWWLLTTQLRNKTHAATMEAWERLGWLFLLIPFVGYLVAKFVTNAFVNRYFIGFLPGIAVAICGLVWRHFRSARLVSSGILLILAGAGLVFQLRTVQQPEVGDWGIPQTRTRHVLQLETSLHNEGKHFFVFTDATLFLAMNYYSKHPEEYVLLIPSPEYLELTNGLRISFSFGKYYPLRFWNLEDLRSHAREAALLDPREFQPTLQAIADAGFQTSVRFVGPIEVDYLQ